jgi:hypothetical protein
MLDPHGRSATNWPIVLAPGDCEDGEFGGMKIGRGKRSTRRKPAPAPIRLPQIPIDHSLARTQAAAVGSQRLTAPALARPAYYLNFRNTYRRLFPYKEEVWFWAAVERSLFEFQKWVGCTEWLQVVRNTCTYWHAIRILRKCKTNWKFLEFFKKNTDILFKSSKSSDMLKILKIFKFVIHR